jgi:Cu-Zn family superoxide dismutase
VVDLVSGGGSGVTGRLEIRQLQFPTKHVRITGTISGLTSGWHGFHVHMTGDIGDDCKNAAGHFNPDNADHGSRCQVHMTSTFPYFLYLCPAKAHIGDLGNIVTKFGVTKIDMVDSVISLGDGTASDISGRAFVVHAGEDDLGQGVGDKADESKKTGNAGARVACGVIRKV